MSLSLRAFEVARTVPPGAGRRDILRAAYAAIPNEKRRRRRLRAQRRLFYMACLSKYRILWQNNEIGAREQKQTPRPANLLEER